jgi:hypothetical protein
MSLIAYFKTKKDALKAVESTISGDRYYVSPIRLASGLWVLECHPRDEERLHLQTDGSVS